MIGQFLEMVDQNSGIVGSTTGSNYYVRILSTLNRELLKPSSSVAMHRCRPAFRAPFTSSFGPVDLFSCPAQCAQPSLRQ